MPVAKHISRCNNTSIATFSLPIIGPWMLSPDGEVADWLGYMLHGKHLREPINVIFVDQKAKTEDEAIDALILSLTSAGYPLRTGHTSGYKGEIDGKKYIQVLKEPGQAFSNGLYLFTNNHGRVFGPCLYKNQIIFTGSFSRERISPFTRIKHVYGSFIKAREDITQRLTEKGEYIYSQTYPLENSLPPDSTETTGDHDGNAVILLRP